MRFFFSNTCSSSGSTQFTRDPNGGFLCSRMIGGMTVSQFVQALLHKHGNQLYFDHCDFELMESCSDKVDKIWEILRILKAIHEENLKRKKIFSKAFVKRLKKKCWLACEQIGLDLVLSRIEPRSCPFSGRGWS